MQLNPVSVDLSKSVFQLSIADNAHNVLKRKRLSRPQFHRWLATTEPVHLVMEACATSNFWGRTASEFGHDVKLLHPRYVTPYVRRNKTDAADADALIRADLDSELKPVPIKSEHQQAIQGLHRVRQQWIGTRTARINTVRGLMAEYGVSLPRGISRIEQRLNDHLDQIPPLLAGALTLLVEEISQLRERTDDIDKQLKQLTIDDPTTQRLTTMPGVAHITATALVGRVTDIHAFPRARSFASWLGLTPGEHSSGQKRRLGSITRAGDSYLRVLLIHGARSALLAAARKMRRGQRLTTLEIWGLDLAIRSGHNKAAVAMANKMARALWAMWTRGEDYVPRFASAQ